MGTLSEGGGDTNAAADPKKDKLFEDRPASKKIIRVVTVIAYMMSVSFVAIVLSGYYVFLWHPPNPRLMHHAQHMRADPQIEYLMDKPPTEITIDETRSLTEIRDKVNVFREEFLRNHGVNISFKSKQEQTEILDEIAVKNSNVSHVERVNLTNHISSNSNSENSDGSTLWNPIVQSLLNTQQTPTTKIKHENLTNIYENVETKSSTRMNRLQTNRQTDKIPKINESSSTAARVSYSSVFDTTTDRQDTLINTSMNDFTLTITKNERNRENKIYSTRPTKRFNYIAKSIVTEINPTHAYELLRNSGNLKVSLERNVDNDQHVTTTDNTMEMSGVEEKVDISNVGIFGGSNLSEITQDSNATASGPRVNDQSNVFTSTEHPNTIGERIKFK